MYSYSKIFIGLCLMLLAFTFQKVSAQQSSLFSHYYWNEQYYNPSYVGSKDMLHAQVLNRLQWVGMDGAPNTISASVHSPLRKENIALGVNFYNDRIGALTSNGITAQYAYRLKFKDGKYTLSLGVQGGAEFRNVHAAKLHTDDGLPDIIAPNEFEKSWMPIFGAGMYFYSENFSLGFGIPQLLPASIFKDEKWGMKPVTEYFISAAYQWNIVDNFRLLPTTTIKILPHQPTQAEFNLNGVFYDKFLAGLGVRTDKSMIFMGQYIHTFSKDDKKLSIGYAYDLSWKALRVTNSGSHEIMVSFDMPVKFSNTSSTIIKSPRYF